MQNRHRKHGVVVGMSGGVDSSVSAYILKKQGYPVAGLFMKNWDEDDHGECRFGEDLSFAEQAAKIIGIPLHTVNLSSEYWNLVFKNFIRSYKKGHTPNPDVLCNEHIKFGAFIEHCQQHLQFTSIATGHYASVNEINGRTALCKAEDSQKDQTYFLYRLTQDSLRNTLFPLADMTKAEVRSLAHEKGLACHDRKDSVGICFVGASDFRKFLTRYLPPKPGIIIDENHNVLGKHEGHWFHTIGQRRGLTIGGLAKYPQKAWYVAKKSSRKNEITVVQGNNHPALFSRKLRAENLRWISGSPPPFRKSLSCKIRHGQPEQLCSITRLEGGKSTVEFSDPQRAAASGQSIVFYQGQECLGGGIVTTVSSPLLRGIGRGGL